MRLFALPILVALAGPAWAGAGPDDGVALGIAYTGEVLAGAGENGRAGGADYVDNLDVTLAARSDDTQFFAAGLYNNGTDFSGSRFSRGWITSNIETGTKAVRLYEAWLDHTLADGKLSLRAGLYDLNSEFDALDAASLFVNPAHGIGTDFSQSGQSGPSIFPVTSLALRLQFKASERTTLRLAVLDGVPGDPANPKRTAIKLGGGDGALLVGELDRRLGDWRLIAGYWRYTAWFEAYGAQLAKRGAQGAYLRGEGLVAGAVEGRGIDAFFRLGWADGRFHEVERFASAGLRWRAPVRGRSNDQAGIALIWSGASPRARRALALSGEPIANSDWAFEATYALALAEWLTVQPSVQYFINPAYEPRRKALMGGLRFVTSWTF